jgi:hypothetical protein
MFHAEAQSFFVSRKGAKFFCFTQRREGAKGFLGCTQRRRGAKGFWVARKDAEAQSFFVSRKGAKTQRFFYVARKGIL